VVLPPGPGEQDMGQAQHHEGLHSSIARVPRSASGRVAHAEDLSEGLAPPVRPTQQSLPGGRPLPCRSSRRRWSRPKLKRPFHPGWVYEEKVDGGRVLPRSAIAGMGPEGGGSPMLNPQWLGAAGLAASTSCDSGRPTIRSMRSTF
jgi:hypothetical protein